MELILPVPGERQGEQLVNLWATIGVPRGGWCCFLGGDKVPGGVRVPKGCPVSPRAVQPGAQLSQGMSQHPCSFPGAPSFFLLLFMSWL